MTDGVNGYEIGLTLVDAPAEMHGVDPRASCPAW
jgi:hypothetical protein